MMPDWVHGFHSSPAVLIFRYMRRWMIWALLALLWTLQALVAFLYHRIPQALLMIVISCFFILIGYIVHMRDRSR